MSISLTIKSIQDIMRKDVGVDGDAQRLSQLVWMLFLKIFDDRETQWELLQDNYKSPLLEKYRWRNWASNSEGLTGDALKNFIDNEMFPALQNLEAKTDNQQAYVIRSVFEDAYNYMKSGQLLRQVINKIQEDVDFNKAQERHLFGDMYEQLLRDLQAAGNAGEFYTPRAVTEFMVRMVNPKLGEKIMDPACGTGGFLTSAIEHIRKQEVKTVEDEVILQKNIHGVEKKPMPHMLCTTNMILHGIDVPSNIKHDNTLAKPLISWSPKERVDIVITNPPFGGNEEDGIETNFPTTFRTKETADLFLVLIMQILKEGGRAALVLPDGFLFGEGIKTRIKEKLLQECNLHTIIRLPKTVFAPYTGIKTNLLFFDKGKPTEEIWFYEQNLPVGIKAFNRTRPMKIKHFDELKNWWGNSKNNFITRKENNNAWKVSIKKIKENNYDFDLINPNIKKKKIRDPNIILSEIKIINRDIISLRNNIKDQITKTLQNSESNNIYKSFFINFDSLFDTENSVTQLKEIILKLAITGKLTLQNPKDNTITELIKKINLHLGNKEKNKSDNKINQNEIPYKLPPSWIWTINKNLFKLIKGKIPKDFNLNETGLPYLDIEALDKNSIRRYTNDLNCIQSKENDILVVCDGSRSGLVLNGKKGVVGSTLAIIDTPNFLQPFIKLIFQDGFKRFNTSMKGAAIPHLDTKNLMKNLTGLPPIDEQKKIVNVVEKLISLCEQLKNKIFKVNNLSVELTNSFAAKINKNL